MRKLLVLFFACATILSALPLSASIVGWPSVSPKELSRTEHKLVVLKFWMYGCPSCVTMAPYFEQAVREFEDRVIFINANIHEHREYIDNEYHIKTVPTLLFFMDGELVCRTGSIGYKQLSNLIKQYGGL